MYIEFALPTGSGGLAAGQFYRELIEQLELWGDRYQIPFVKKQYKYTVRVTFDQDKHYDLFALTWRPGEHYLADYRLIEPMKRV